MMLSLVIQVLSLILGLMSFSYKPTKLSKLILMSACFSIRNSRSHACASFLVAKPRFNFCCRSPFQSVYRNCTYHVPFSLFLNAAKLEAGEISKEEYDRWRYRYPEFDTTGIWAKVPPKQISDWLTEAFNPGK